MSENIVKIKEAPSIIGCEKVGCSVVVEGREIPYMTCMDLGEQMQIILADRFGYTFPKEYIYDIVHFAAQAMAIGMGYPWLGAPNKDRPFAPQVMQIEIKN